MNTGARWPTPDEAKAKVLRMQTKLQRWASEDHDRQFNDLYNLVCDPAFLIVGWQLVRHNKGTRSAGVDGMTVEDIQKRASRRSSTTCGRNSAEGVPPPAVRERMIPKANGKLRRLGIPTVRDRVVQAALKMVLEPIFEEDFQPFSYGFRPGRRAHDAIAEIVYYGNRTYEWVLEGDIEACFDNIDHSALLDRVRHRVGDRKVVALVKAFLEGEILSELGQASETPTGTPQGGILSPLLANIALSKLDDLFAQDWRELMAERRQRTLRRQRGNGNWRLVRYADDWVALVSGTRDHAVALDNGQRRCWLLSDFGFLRARPRSHTWTRASISSASTSSGRRSEERRSDIRTCTPLRRPSRLPEERCASESAGQCPAEKRRS